jgi:hypothetical protein
LILGTSTAIRHETHVEKICPCTQNIQQPRAIYQVSPGYMLRHLKLTDCPEFAMSWLTRRVRPGAGTSILSRVMCDWQSSQAIHGKFCGKTEPHWEQMRVRGLGVCERTTGIVGMLRPAAMGLRSFSDICTSVVVLRETRVYRALATRRTENGRLTQAAQQIIHNRQGGPLKA